MTKINTAARENFKNKLCSIRKNLGLTQGELAKMAGFDRTAICHFERGRRTPSMANLIVLCQTLGCSADDLLGTAPTEEENQ